MGGRASAKTDYSSGHVLISSNLKRDAILGLHKKEDPPQNQSRLANQTKCRVVENNNPKITVLLYKDGIFYVNLN